MSVSPNYYQFYFSLSQIHELEVRYPCVVLFLYSFHKAEVIYLYYKDNKVL